ncbi:MAG: hypothetical protein QOE90_3084 [Thermoplasmata archaeon]|jgi:hypothetical protein|nr:hypothetical protein [Thermoplasmata archaeon]
MPSCASSGVVSLLRKTALIAALLLTIPLASSAFALPLPVPPQPSPDPTPGGGAGTNNGTNNGTGNQTGGNNSTSPPPTGLAVQVNGPTVAVAGSTYTFVFYVGWHASGDPRPSGNTSGNNTTQPGNGHAKTETVSLAASLVGAAGTVSIPASATVTDGAWTRLQGQVTFDVTSLPGSGEIRIRATDADGTAEGDSFFQVV